MKKATMTTAGRSARLLACGAIGAVLTGCSSQITHWGHYEGHGDAVRNMVAQQTLDPTASDVDPVASMRPIDANKAARVLEIHREDIAKPEEVSDDIIVNIGN